MENLQKYLVIAGVIFTLFLFSFMSPQDVRYNSPHHTLTNSDLVVSIRVDSVLPNGSMMITSVASIDTSSEYGIISYDLLQFVAKNGPGTIAYVDGGQTPTPIDSLKRDERDY